MRPDKKKVSTSTDIPIWELAFDILFYMEGGQVVAHCLQTDTAAQAPTLLAAKRRIRAALETELDEAIRDNDLAEVVRTQAPLSVWRRIETATDLDFVHITINAEALPKEHRRFKAVRYFLEGVLEAA